MPQSNYDFPGAVAKAGNPGSRRAAELARVDSKLNPVIFDTWTVEVTGTASDGIYSFEIEPGGAVVSFDRQSAEDDDAIADGLAASGAVPAALQGKITVTKTATDTITVVAKDPSLALLVVAVGEPGSGTLTPVNTVPISDEVRLALGIGVINGALSGSNETAAVPTTASEISDFDGVTRRDEAAIDSQDRLATDGFSASAMIGIQKNEDIWVQVTTAVTKESDPHWIITGDDAGKFRGSLLGTAQVMTLTCTAEDDQFYKLKVTLSNGRSYSFTLDSGSSATATTIADDFRTLMAADANFTKHVVASGTATLILTSVSGVTFDVLADVTIIATGLDSATGAIIVVFTTPGVVQSHMLESKSFATATSASGIAKIRLG